MSEFSAGPCWATHSDAFACRQTVANAVVGILKDEAASCSLETIALLVDGDTLVKEDDEGCIEEAVPASDIDELAMEVVLMLGNDPSA